MKLILLVILSFFSLTLFSQVVVEGPWTLECGASTCTTFRESASFNLRYISPRFRWSEDELSEEDEKHPEKFKNARLMLEVIYKPPFNALCTGFNAQYRLIRLKRFSLEAYGGLKLFFVPGTDFASIPPLRKTKDVWYLNLGLLCQVNLGVIAPFADIGGDSIITIGTEFNFHAIYRKPKKRYKLHPKDND